MPREQQEGGMSLAIELAPPSIGLAFAMAVSALKFVEKRRVDASRSIA
jgi:hypothetical protein